VLKADADGRFFKNRSWLRLEFPELIAKTEADVGPFSFLSGRMLTDSLDLKRYWKLDVWVYHCNRRDVGADDQGAGNTAYPLLQHNENPDLVIWATDYSSTAVDVVKVRHPLVLG
jgi:tRNAThr (cytosine32-N3)-methyltransferase